VEKIEPGSVSSFLIIEVSGHMLKRPLTQRWIAVCLSLLVTGSFLPASFAEGDASVYQKLTEYENVLFGKADTALPVEKRLQNIEKQLFGKPAKGGSTSRRLEAVEKAVNGSKYLPPVAPELDRSEFAPQPKKAPESSTMPARDIDNQDEAPLPADAADRTKGLLRDAMQFYSQGKIADAERLYQKVLAIDFRNADANYNLGAIAESKNDLNSARRYYSTALKANPGDYEIQDALKAVQEKLKNQPIASASPAPTASEAAPGGPVAAGDRAIAEVAAASYKKGNFDDAIQRLAYLARKNPYDANTQFALGQAFRGKGDLTNARKHLRSAASLDPKNDLYVKTLNDIESLAEDGSGSSGNNGSSGNGSSGNGNGSSGNGSGSTGWESTEQPGHPGDRHSGNGGDGSNDVTPFVGLPNNRSSSAGSDLADAENYLRRNSGNGIMIGSVSGFGTPMWGGGGGGGWGMPMMLGTASGTTRLTRIMGSSLSGAAFGALNNRGLPGGMSRGAMRGAMYGGLFGLMTGGF
jgi:Flp pilus assembly protein TadD